MIRPPCYRQNCDGWASVALIFGAAPGSSLVCIPCALNVIRTFREVVDIRWMRQ